MIKYKKELTFVQEKGIKMGLFRKKSMFEDDSKPVAAIKRVFRFIKENKWLSSLFVLGVLSGVGLGYYVGGGSTGLFIVALASLLGFIGHVIDER